jgi:pimeloyl-ACP methyl ester carboxylesterase
MPCSLAIAAAVTHPVLILAWDTDTGHPVSTAQKLADLLPKAELHISHTLADVRTWGDRAAAFFGD